MLEMFTSNPRTHSAISTSIAVPEAPRMPTLLTRMLSRPNLERASCTAEEQEVGEVTSPWRGIIIPRAELVELSETRHTGFLVEFDGVATA